MLFGAVLITDGLEKLACWGWRGGAIRVGIGTSEEGGGTDCLEEDVLLRAEFVCLLDWIR